MKKDFPQRKNLRLKGYDYSSDGAYFLTICVKTKHVLSKIVGGDVLGAPEFHAIVQLTEFGQIAEKYIRKLNDFYEHIDVYKYVIMPDHIHVLLIVNSGGASRTSPRTKEKPRQHSTVSFFVSTLKRFCNKEYGENIWQRSFYDECIRNSEDFIRVCKYIDENPMKATSL